MRRPLSTATLVFMLALALAMMLSTAGCDYGGSPTGETASARPAQSTPLRSLPDDPRAMLEAAIEATEAVNRYACSVQVDAQMNLDPETLPEDDAMFLGMLQGPLTISGDMSIDEDEQAAQMDLSLGISGITYSMGLRAKGDQTWMSILGRWYDLSPAMQEADGSDAFAQDLDVEAVESRLDELDIDPLDWLGEITLAGEETEDGLRLYHLVCAPDVSLMLDDILVLIGDEALLTSIDPSGELLDSMLQDPLSEADIQEVRALLPEMLSDLTVHLWVGKDDSLFRRMEFSVHFEPPPGEPSDGLESVDLQMEVTLEALDGPVQVEVPQNVLPYTDLEAMFGDMLGGMFGSELPLPLDEMLEDPTRS